MTSPHRNRPPTTLPTAAELDILAILCRLGMATVREVHDDLGNDNRYTTTLKTMQLMTEKGLLVRGERERLNALRSSEEFLRLNNRAALVVNNLGVITAFIGEELQRLFTDFGTQASELS